MCFTIQRYFSTVWTRDDLGTAPMTTSTFWPPLNSMTVGIDRMPYSVAMDGDSSVLSLYCGGREQNGSKTEWG